MKTLYTFFFWTTFILSNVSILLLIFTILAPSLAPYAAITSIMTVVAAVGFLISEKK